MAKLYRAQFLHYKPHTSTTLDYEDARCSQELFGTGSDPGVMWDSRAIMRRALRFGRTEVRSRATGRQWSGWGERRLGRVSASKAASAWGDMAMSFALSDGDGDRLVGIVPGAAASALPLLPATLSSSTSPLLPVQPTKNCPLRLIAGSSYLANFKYDSVAPPSWDLGGRNWGC
jgi:hypothetical protein